MDLERAFLDNLPLIERIIRFACRRHRWNADQSEEFAGAARLKLIENDYSVLRAFRGRSSLSTYLTAVILRFALDHHRQIAGRWRPSAQAESLGPSAVRLEALLYRDGHTLEEAVQVMASETDTREADLRQLAASIRPRLTIREEAMEEAPEPAAPQPAADELVRRAELGTAGAKVAQVLNAALLALNAEDRLILRLRYHESFPVAEIARMLGMSQKGLYRRFDRLQLDFRQALAEANLLGPANRELLEHPDLLAELEIFRPEGGKTAGAPSNASGEGQRRAPPLGAGGPWVEEDQSPGGPHAG
jgi:RNA polymerase sigma factor (sigma-70 family)